MPVLFQEYNKQLASHLLEEMKARGLQIQPLAVVIGAASIQDNIPSFAYFLGPLFTILATFFAKHELYGAVITNNGVYIASMTLSAKINFIQFYDWSRIKITKINEGLLNKQIVFEAITPEGKSRKFTLKSPEVTPKEALGVLKKLVVKQ